jgi:hypothetical protein
VAAAPKSAQESANATIMRVIISSRADANRSCRIKCRPYARV